MNEIKEFEIDIKTDDKIDEIVRWLVVSQFELKVVQNSYFSTGADGHMCMYIMCTEEQALVLRMRFG